MVPSFFLMKNSNSIYLSGPRNARRLDKVFDLASISPGPTPLNTHYPYAACAGKLEILKILKICQL